MIPARVVHDRPCRGLCFHSEPSAWACFEQLDKITHRHISEVKDIEDLTCVIGFKITMPPPDAVRWHFGLVVLKMGQGTAAVGKASEAWLELDILNAEIVRQDDFPSGARLRFGQWDYIDHGRDDKFTQAVTTGRFKFFVSADFLARVVGKVAVSISFCATLLHGWSSPHEANVHQVLYEVATTQEPSVGSLKYNSMTRG